MRGLKSVLGVFVVGGVVSFSSCNHHYYSANTIKGDGNIITSEKTVSPFSAIQTQGSVDVNFYANSEYRANVIVDANLLEYVEISVKNNTLYIGVKNGSYSFTKFVVDVYCPTVSGISISGSGNFKGMDKIIVPKFESKIADSGNIAGTFECDEFSAHISGSGDINGYVECKDFSTTISGSGNITLKGNTTNLNVKVSGSGDFNAVEFKTNNADISISGSGDVTVSVEDNLKARISGSGKIKYRGNPKIDFSSSGSGRLISYN